MKIRFLIFALLFATLTCCKKDTNSTTQKFGYTLNSVAFDWDLPFGSNLQTGAIIVKYPVPNGLNDTIYLLKGWDQSKNIIFNLSIPSKVLATGTYNTKVSITPGVTLSSYSANGTQFFPISIGDSTQVIITNISNNYADGSFKAVMHDFSTNTSKIEIVNGYFNHLEISK